MKTYSLKKELIFGIKEIDEQHERLLEIINDFNQIDADKISRDDFIDVFNGLINYAHIHFNDEEALQEKLNYPDKENHILEHQEFLKKINELFLSFSENEKKACLRNVSNFLTEWVEDHLMNVDAKFAKFYLNK